VGNPQLTGEEKAMENRFDELAKAVAEGMSRREVLSRLRGVLAGGALAFLGMRAASAAPPCPPGEHLSICDLFDIFPSVEICCPHGKHCKFFVLVPYCAHGHG
jgi:hypothetical protein